MDFLHRKVSNKLVSCIQALFSLHTVRQFSLHSLLISSIYKKFFGISVMLPFFQRSQNQWLLSFKLTIISNPNLKLRIITSNHIILSEIKKKKKQVIKRKSTKIMFFLTSWFLSMSKLGFLDNHQIEKTHLISKSYSDDYRFITL